MEDLKTIETVDTSPFKRLCMTIGELPASFVDSMTYYECLAWLVNYLQKTVIPAVNNNAEATKELQEAFITLKAYVDNYFANLDVQEEINNKLDEMATSGELADIIEAYLGYVNSGKHTPEYVFTRYRQTGTPTAFSNSTPREMEGIVKTGGNKIVVFYRPSNVTDSSNVLVEEIDYTDKTNPTILRSATIPAIGSANSACYDPNTGKIYSWVSGATFAVIDYETLNYTGTITIPDINLASCIAYDSEAEKYYITEGLHVWELNISDYSTTLLFTFGNNQIKNGLQGFEARNDSFYFALSCPMSVVVTSKTGTIKNILSLDCYDNAGHYMMYIADITFADDNTLLLTPHSEGDYVEFTRAKSSYYVNYVAKLNLKGNNFEVNEINGSYQSKEFYLDTSLIEDGVAYCDGSSTYKFRLVSEYLTNKYKRECSFRCNAVSPVTYYGTLIMSDENLGIAGELVCEGGSIRNSSIMATTGIKTNSARLTTYGSTIYAPYIKFGFNDATDKNTFISSNLIVSSLSDTDGVEANAVYALQNSSIMPLNCYVLFSTDNIAGASDVTVGDIRSFKKIKVIVTDSSSQQFSEEAIVPSSGDIYLNFNRITFAATTGGNIKSSRMTIARTTGVITLDREYNVALAPTPTITITADTSPRVKILRVEGYK